MVLICKIYAISSASSHSDVQSITFYTMYVNRCDVADDMGMSHFNGLFFHILTLGSAFQRKTLRHRSVFSKMFKILGVHHPQFLKSEKLAYILRKKSLEMGTFFSKNDPQKWVSKIGQYTPHPNQILTPATRIRDQGLYNYRRAADSELLYSGLLSISGSC